MKNETKRDDAALVAAGVAFYGFLSLFPALAAVISIYGLVANPAAVEALLSALRGILPQEVVGVLGNQLSRLVSQSTGTLGLSLAFSVLIALWSANKGMRALIKALNIAFDEEEKRGFIKVNLVSLVFTLGGILFAVVAVAAVVALPALLATLERNGLPTAAVWVLQWLRWPVLAAIVLFALVLVYRYAPSRARPQWRWVTWGSAVATGLWLAGSALFSWYVSSFGKYNQVYGSVGAIVVLLIWMFLSSFVVVLGAEINSETERQTVRDSTEGPSHPPGARGAYAADTVGASP